MLNGWKKQKIAKQGKGDTVSEFTIEVGKVKSVVSTQKDVASTLSICENMIRETQRVLSVGDSRVTTLLKNNIRELSEQVSQEKQLVRLCYSSLETIVSEYQRTEKNLVSTNGVQKVTINTKPENSSSEKTMVPEWVKNMWKLVGKAGPVGKGIQTVGKFAADIAFGTFSAKTIANATSDIWNTAWDVGKNISKMKTDKSSVTWKEWLGFGSGNVGKIAHSNIGAVNRAKHGAASNWKHAIRELNTKSGRIKQVGGIVLAGVVNGFSNYDEYAKKYSEGKVTKEYAVGRAVLETVGETAVDWGKNILIGSAVAAGFAAAGVAAPAVAVGAVTVGISIAADWACKKITGKFGGEEKGVTELVSDTIIDLGEKFVKAKENVVSSIWSGLNRGYLSMKNGIAYA